MKVILIVLLLLGRFAADTPSLHYVAGWLSDAGQWSALGVTRNPLGPTGPDIRAIAVAPDGSVYIGGEFVGWDGIPGRDYIARYVPSTETWQTVGADGDINGIVEALAFGPGGTLYVGGSFTNAGGDANADYLARWDGAALSAVGGAPTRGNAAVQAIAVTDSGDVYIGGQFTNWGGDIAADKVAYWDASVSAWAAVGSGMDNTVHALAFDAGGDLYAGGAFTLAGGARARYLARWDGSDWSQVGDGLNDSALALQTDSTGLFVAGEFTDAWGGPGRSLNHVARWDGVAFRALGTGANGDVFALALGPDGTLFCGGSFTVIGGLSVGHGRAGKWNGHAWERLDIDLPGSAQVLSLAVESISYDVFAGFDTAAADLGTTLFFPLIRK